ncbi:agmatinase [Microvirga arabica]|uniref:agmatinase n=1 Tax=Microvirga arabica TaxID=1128671 RepID=UPI00193A2634|nr:agmatinase [Microvirga arabica]MBM1173865.1 agmatinase [Microvirga arabica]
MAALTRKSDRPNLFGSASGLDLDSLEADVAFLGVPVGSPYSEPELASDQTKAPDALRAATAGLMSMDEAFDFDIGGTVLDGRPIRLVDCGNVLVDPADLGASSRNAEAAVRKILKARALPIVIGGDHSVPIPVLRAYDDQDGPVTLIQIDAHLDWRNELHGIRDGYSSPMRRASEMPHVGELFQIGIRGQGSARPEEVAAARAYQAHIIPAYEVHDRGMQSVLDRIPPGGRYYVTLDADGMDPSVMPAVAFPTPGGLTYPQIRTLIQGLATKGRIVGMDIVEITPSRDFNDLTVIAASGIINILIGAAVRAGYFQG